MPMPADRAVTIAHLVTISYMRRRQETRSADAVCGIRRSKPLGPSTMWRI